MRRNFGSLKDGAFDILVVGGGIYGAWTAAEAARRGFRVALIDQGDWGSATSSASSKLIHGGLRYLAQLRFGLVRKSLQERERLRRMAPHRVRPLEFVIPLFPDRPASRLSLSAGLSVYDFLTTGHAFPRHTFIRPEDCARRFSFLNDRRLAGGFSYSDAATDDFRLTLDVVRSAREAGAVTVNYAKAEELLRSRGRICGAAVTDGIDGQSAEIAASLVVYTAGPWVGRIGPWRGPAPIRLTRGVHLTLPALPSDNAFLFMKKSDKRVIFLIPWYGRTLLGTTDTDFRGDPEAVRVEPADIDYLLSEAGARLRGTSWDEDAVRGSFAGLRTLVDGTGRAPSSVSREWLVVETEPGLYCSIGGKLTSARADAVTLVNRLNRKRRPSGAASAAPRPFPFAPAGEFENWRAEATERGITRALDRETALAAAHRFGTDVVRLFTILEEEPGLASRIHPELPFCLGEILYAARHEMAVHLHDLLRRRIPLTVLARPDRDVAERAAGLAAPVLDWDDERKSREIDRLMDLWEPG